MDKIFNFSIKELSFNLTQPSFEQIRKSNLLRIFLKEYVIREITKNINISKNEFEDAKKVFYKEKNIFETDQLNEYLLFNGINEEDLEYQISLPIKINILSTKVLQNKIENHFLKRKDELDLYKYNVIRVESSNLAHEIYFQLEGGESNFLTLSNKYSFDKKVFPDGIVGPRNIVGMHSSIKEKLRKNNIGSLITPFQIDKWWLIIKLLGKETAKLDEQTTKQMALELCEIFVQDRVSELIKKNFSNL